MPTSDAVPSGDAGWSWRPPLADGESFILFPPQPTDPGAHEMDGGGKGRENRGKGPSLYTKSHAFPSMCARGSGLSSPAPSLAPPPNSAEPPAGRRKGTIFSIRGLKFTSRLEAVGRSKNTSSNSSEGFELAGKGQADGNAQRRRLRGSGSTRRHAGTAKPPPARRLNSDLDAASFRRTAPSSRGRFRRRNADPTAAGGDSYDRWAPPHRCYCFC